MQGSRRHRVQLLDRERIDCRKAVSRRRVRSEEFLAFHREMESRRREALNELTARNQAFGLH